MIESSDVAYLFSKYSSHRVAHWTVKDPIDVAEFFAWYAVSWLGLRHSLEITTQFSSFCVCEALRCSRTEDGYFVGASGMVADSSGSAYDFAASIVPLMIQCNPEDLAEVSAACPNNACSKR